MSNYDRIEGATLSVWEQDSDDMEPLTDNTVTIEEMYFAYGDIVMTFSDDERGEFFDLQIPVKAKESWNEFVKSLPIWMDV